jgi:hypothetical protein
MPRRYLYHQAVRTALEKDLWTITHDPLVLPFGGRDLFVDLAAEAPIAAEKDGRKIAVEIKTFLGASEVTDFERMLGQYTLYRTVMEDEEPGRSLYVAVTEAIFTGFLREIPAEKVLRKVQVKLLVFNPEQEVILQWIE